MVSVVLLNPKTPANVGGVLRACSIFYAEELRWTGYRVQDGRLPAAGTQFAKNKWRLPREERMKAYQHVNWGVQQDAVDHYIDMGLTPVCVEVDPSAELLPYFDHPEDACYIFGPEDSGVDKGTRHVCHRFVTIPSVSCLNLAATVNVVLYDRLVKSQYADSLRNLEVSLDG
jgi:tRNA(Leu) C34 or U34 (ribose-2'-O)-methylase TrmL